MRILTSALVLLFSLAATAKTDFSKTIAYVQKTYANAFKNYPILIFDMDDLGLRYAKADAFGDSDEKEDQRAAIIQQYVKEKIGVELTHAEATSYEMYTTALKDSAFALPTLQGSFGDKTYKMCAVFPSSPSSNKRLETMRITGMNTKEAYEGVTYAGLQEKMEMKEMELFSLYHELGHCLDQYFMPETYNTYQVDPHDIHVSESYAEVFALFMLEREGYSGLGRTRALLRNMYTQKMGKWFIENRQLGMGDPRFEKGGLIYYLAPALLGADNMLDRGGQFISGPVEGILAKAKEIVDKYSLKGQSFHAVHRAMSEPREKVLNFYREFAEDSPQYFLKPYQDILLFLDFSPYLLEQVVGDAPDDNEGVDFEPLNMAELCSYENDMALHDRIQELRDELRQPGFAFASQEKRKKELDTLYETLAACP